MRVDRSVKRGIFFFFCLTHIFSVNVQELACSASYSINKTLIPNKKTNEITKRKTLSLVGRNTMPMHHKRCQINQVWKTKVIKNNSQQVKKSLEARRR